MARAKIPTLEQAPAQAQPILQNYVKVLGLVPNFFALISQSPDALKAIADMHATLGMSLTVFFYETTHMASHVPYVPKTRYGQYMRKFHLWHHFQNEHYWFGVTHPLLDGVFGTWKHSKDVDRSPTARTLGVDS